MKVYIASPYTKGDRDKNVYRSMVVGDLLMDMGFTPFMPLLTHFFHKHFPKSWGVWMEYDLSWLDRCDCLLRLNGESKGADREVEYAKEKDIPIFTTIEDLVKYREGKLHRCGDYELKLYNSEPCKPMDFSEYVDIF